MLKCCVYIFGGCVGVGGGERERLDDYLGNLGYLSIKRKPKIFEPLANK